MINLLPPQLADSIRYGRHNAGIRRWMIAIGLATLGLVVITALGWLYLDSQAKSLAEGVAANEQQLTAQNLTQVQKDADEITSNIKVIDQVLTREIRFSELIQEIGQVMPPGTILSGLTLKNKIDGALDLSTNTKDYASAAQVAVNLSDPKNELFSSVDIVTINCASSENAYKCSASFRALFSKEAKTRFLNVAKDDQ